MTAASNIDGLKARNDPSGAGKDQVGFIDIGLNPESKLAMGTGQILWTASGAVTVGLGDNRGFGGTNASDFALPTQIGGATVKVDGKTVIDRVAAAANAALCGGRSIAVAALARAFAVPFVRSGRGRVLRPLRI